MTTGSTGGITGSGVSKGVAVAKKLMVDLNIKPAAAAGIVGNLMLESGLKPDNVENGKGFEDGARPGEDLSQSVASVRRR